jgi:two-component sensor histidine kinase
MVCVSRNITERKLDEEKILNLLNEKELILKEVHHRIKNNMNTIYALLMLQSDMQDNINSKNSLTEAAGRVQTMMLLYNKLYRSESVNAISIKEFLPSIIDEIVKVFPQSSSVKIMLDLQDVMLSSQTLSPLGIIINELFTNSMKYAFKGRTNNAIKISVSKNNSSIIVEFADNGVGLPDEITSINSSGFGLQLVDMLVQQIDGTVEIIRENGTKFVIEFGV